MAGVAMRMLTPYLRWTRKPLTATPERAAERLAERKRPAPPPGRLRRKFRVGQHSVDGFTCYSVAGTPDAGAGPRSAVLYLHGGSYTSPITGWHWRFIAGLASAGHRVEVPLYGLAPGHNHREAVPLLAAVYQQLLRRHAAEDITFMGDSAGGGLALAFAEQLPGLSLPQPGHLILLSPWVDVAMRNPELADVEARDPWLSRAGLRVSAESWAAGDPLDDPRISPLNGNLAGLPPTDLFAGTRDLPYPDIRRLATAMRKAGCRVALHVAEDGVHVYPLLPVPEGRAARKQILAILRRA